MKHTLKATWNTLKDTTQVAIDAMKAELRGENRPLSEDLGLMMKTGFKGFGGQFHGFYKDLSSIFTFFSKPVSVAPEKPDLKPRSLEYLRNDYD